MGENLEVQIRKLQEFYWSDADPQGRGFVPLADLYRRIGDFSEARRILRDGLSRHENMASAHVVLGWAYLDQGEVAQAEASFRAALAVDPGNIRALKGLGDILLERGQADEALEVHRALHALDPLDGEVPDRLAELEAQMESRAQLQEVEALEEVLEAQEELRVWEDREAVADSLDWETASVQEDRSPKGAVGARAAEEGVAEEAPSPAMEAPAPTTVDGPEDDEAPAPAVGPEAGSLITRTMGEIYLRQGLVSEARWVFETLLGKDPGNEELEARLREVDDLLLGREPLAKEPAEVVPIADLAPDTILPVADLAPDQVTPTTESPPDVVVSIEELAPDVIVPMGDLEPDVIVPVEALAPDAPPEDPTLGDFEAWLDSLQ